MALRGELTVLLPNEWLCIGEVFLSFKTVDVCLLRKEVRPCDCLRQEKHFSCPEESSGRKALSILHVDCLHELYNLVFA